MRVCGWAVVRRKKGFEVVEVADLDAPSSFFLAAEGGKPGLGNCILAGKPRTKTGNHFRSPGQPGEGPWGGGWGCAGEGARTRRLS